MTTVTEVFFHAVSWMYVVKWPIGHPRWQVTNRTGYENVTGEMYEDDPDAVYEPIRAIRDAPRPLLEPPTDYVAYGSR